MRDDNFFALFWVFFRNISRTGMQCITVFTKSPWSNVLSRESDGNPSVTEEMGDVSRLIKPVCATSFHMLLLFMFFFLLQHYIKNYKKMAIISDLIGWNCSRTVDNKKVQIIFLQHIEVLGFFISSMFTNWTRTQGTPSGHLPCGRQLFTGMHW